MKKRLIIDYETYSEVDLKKVGAYKYATHPSTEILCIGYQIDDREPKLWFPSLIPIAPEDLAEAYASNRKIIAHNAFFEWCITNFVLRKHFPDYFAFLLHERMSCTASRARYRGLPGKLETLAQALRLQVEKDMEGHRLMLRMTKPKKPSKKDPSTRVSDKKSFLRLGQYCLTDIIVEAQADDILPELPPNERRLWLLDQKMNARGVHSDTSTCKIILDLVKEYEENLKYKLWDLTDGQVETVKQNKVFLEYLRGLGLEIPNLQKNTINDFIKDIDKDSKAFELLKIRQTLSKSSTKKYDAFIKRADENGIVRDLFVYHVAPTGRDGGSGIQPQNFPRGSISDVETGIELIQHKDLELIESFYEDPMALFSSCLRSMIIARPNKLLACADYNAIELRVLMWLTGQSDAVKMLDRGIDIYSVVASLIFGFEVNKDDHPDERFIGKETVLGGGYQMGWKKFQKTLWDKWRRKISDELAQKIINTYRIKFSKVPEFWKTVEQAAIYTTKTGKITKHNGLVWDMDDTTLRVKLPSGRHISYPDAEVKNIMTEWGELKPTLHYWGVGMNKKWVREASYGGKLTENICQGIARDIMKFGKLNCESAGYSVLLAVHDELLAERDKVNIDEFIKLMTTLPPWAKGCPIKAEKPKGWVDGATRYKK